MGSANFKNYLPFFSHHMKMYNFFYTILYL